MKKRLPWLLLLLMAALLVFAACSDEDIASDETEYLEEDESYADADADKELPDNSTEAAEDNLTVEPDGQYSDPDSVALYIHTYGELPSNFLTKSEAEDLGWDSNAGNLWEVAPGCSIGGDKFGNREGLLPKADGRKYYECDINYTGGYRNGERIVFSNDGLIFYSDDHYQSFIQLY